MSWECVDAGLGMTAPRARPTGRGVPAGNWASTRDTGGIKGGGG